MTALNRGTDAEPNVALAVVQALVTLGWRPPAHTPDVDYLHGVNDAVTEVRRQFENAVESDEECAVGVVRHILRDVAEGLGVDEDAPSGPLSATQAAQDVSGVGPDTSGAEKASAGSEIVHLIRQDYGTTGCCYRTPFELPSSHRLTLNPDAVTCERNRRADEHGKECR
jgi:hypothetical protein